MCKQNSQTKHAISVVLTIILADIAVPDVTLGVDPFPVSDLADHNMFGASTAWLQSAPVPLCEGAGEFCPVTPGESPRIAPAEKKNL